MALVSIFKRERTRLASPPGPEPTSCDRTVFPAKLATWFLELRVSNKSVALRSQVVTERKEPVVTLGRKSDLPGGFIYHDNAAATLLADQREGRGEQPGTNVPMFPLIDGLGLPVARTCHRSEDVHRSPDL